MFEAVAQEWAVGQMKMGSAWLYWGGGAKPMGRLTWASWVNDDMKVDGSAVTCCWGVGTGTGKEEIDH